MKKLFFAARYAVLSAVLLLGSCLTAAAQFNVASPACMAHTVSPLTTTTFSYTLTGAQVFSRWGVIGDISIPNTVGTVVGAMRSIAVTSTGFGKGRLALYVTSSGCSTESAINLDINKLFAQSTVLPMPTSVTFTGQSCVVAGQPYGYVVSSPLVSTAAQIAAGLADTYTWDIPTGATAVFSGDKSAALITMPATFTTKRYVRVAIGACNAANIATSFLEIPLTTQPLKPVLAFVSGIVSCKADQMPFTLSYYAEAGVNYTWSIPATWSITYSTGNTGANLVSSYALSGTQSVNITPGNATYGDIGVTASYSTGGCGTTTALPYPITRQTTTANTITPSVSGCLTTGSNVTFSVNSGFPQGTVYKWTLPAGWAATANSGSVITVPVGTASGDVTVQVVPNPLNFPNVVCNNAPPAKLAVTVSGPNGCGHQITIGCGTYQDSRLSPVPLTAGCITTIHDWTITGPTGNLIASSATAPSSPNPYGATFLFSTYYPTTSIPAGSVIRSIATNPGTCLRVVTTTPPTVADYIPGVSCRGINPNPGNGGSSVSVLTEQAVVYPNPTGSLLQVNLPVKQAGTSRLTLTDALGRVVLTRTTEDTRTTLDVRHLPAGTYTLRTTVPGGKEQAQTVVIEH